jgi:hypothetical protein
MPHLRVALQLLLFLVFAIGGAHRLSQPIDLLAKKMLWVSYFDPLVVRAISLIEIVCGIGIVLPFLLKNPSFDFLFYSGSLLMVIMLGAALTHIWIGDYRQIFGNLLLLSLLFFVTFPDNLTNGD